MKDYAVHKVLAELNLTKQRKLTDEQEQLLKSALCTDEDELYYQQIEKLFSNEKKKTGEF